MLRALRRAGQLKSGLQCLAAKATLDGVAVAPASWSAVAGFSTATMMPSISLLRHSALPATGCWAVQTARQFRSGAALWESLDVKVPSMGESVSEGMIAAVLKKPGDAVKEDDVIAQIETDKVTIDVKYTSKQGGKISQIHIKEQDIVQTGKMVCTVELGEEGEEAAPEPPKAPEPKAAQAPAAASKPPPPPPPPPPSPSQPAAPSPPKTMSGKPSPAADAASPVKALKPERRVKMTRLRMRVAERLKGAQNTYAMLSTFNEVDMSSLMEMRTTYKDMFLDKHGVKLGFMSAFIKASAYALNEVPAVNAVIDGDEIVYRDYVDISIAVATPKGLVVPVLRSADKLSFAQCEKNLNELGKKAREGTISIDDMAGGTFTISNGGVYGSMLSTPIINPPQSAILGMHAIVQRPTVVGGGKIEARPIMNIALTYDHRLIDGREAVTFLKRVKEVIEDPRRMLIDC